MEQQARLKRGTLDVAEINVVDLSFALGHFWMEGGHCGITSVCLTGTWMVPLSAIGWMNE
jgi:hypothetical protein